MLAIAFRGRTRFGDSSTGRLLSGGVAVAVLSGWLMTCSSVLAAEPGAGDEWPYIKFPEIPKVPEANAQEVRVTMNGVAVKVAVDRVTAQHLANLSVETTSQRERPLYWGSDEFADLQISMIKPDGNVPELTDKGKKKINLTPYEKNKIWSGVLISGESFLRRIALRTYYKIPPGEYSVPVTVFPGEQPFVTVTGLCTEFRSLQPEKNIGPLKTNFSEVKVDAGQLAVRASVGRTPEYEAVILALEVQNHRDVPAYWGEDWGFFDCRVNVTDAEGKRVKLTPKGEKHWQNIRDEPAEYVPLILQPGDSHTRYLDLAEYCVLPAGTYYVSATFMPNRLREKTIIRISGLQMKVRPPVRPREEVIEAK